MSEVRVHIEPQLSRRLNDSSARRRFYPYDDHIIDWSVPIDDTHVYMPDGYSVVDGTPVADALTLAEKSFLTRWEATCFLRNNHIGEHILNQSLLALLHKTNPYDPAWRYMLHEVAEECQHMKMFNQWVRINPDIRTKGLGQDVWGVPVSMLAPVIATRFPVILWTLTLTFEVFGDDFARRAARRQPENIHPIIRQIGRTHMVEEARHIAFAEEWLRNQVPKLPRLQRVGLNRLIETILERAIRIGLPERYSTQIAHLVSYESFRAGLRGDHRRRLIAGIYAPLAKQLAELG
ncbi:MAG: hypothetical protein D6761_07530, partial [Candidatus Dadabacteria bacterium]